MGTKVLSEELFDEASDFVLHSARALERNTYNQVFGNGKSDKSLLELKNYQNPDGGFGHGLEPDLRLPYSSPITTTYAFRHVKTLGSNTKVARNLIRSGINYFEDTFQNEEGRWFSVPPKVNDFPHAPWWHYDADSGKTTVDEFWGNPTAEILAYGLKYDGFSDTINLENLIKTAIRKLNSREEFNSEHEIYCYLKLYKSLPSNESKKIKDQLSNAVNQLVCRDPSKWSDHVPQPVNFVTGPESPTFGISESIIEKNLDFLIDRINEDGVIEPSWEWGQFESEWERAKLEWTGILTLKTLILLDKFDRISCN